MSFTSAFHVFPSFRTYLVLLPNIDEKLESIPDLSDHISAFAYLLVHTLLSALWVAATHIGVEHISIISHLQAVRLQIP